MYESKVVALEEGGHGDYDLFYCVYVGLVNWVFSIDLMYYS